MSSLKKNICLYCNEQIRNEEEKHFVSDCCWRWMCQECYDNLIWTDKQIQVSYFDREPEDEEIIKKCWRERAGYICFDCYGNWKEYASKKCKSFLAPKKLKC